MNEASLTGHVRTGYGCWQGLWGAKKGLKIIQPHIAINALKVASQVRLSYINTGFVLVAFKSH